MGKEKDLDLNILYIGTYRDGGTGYCRAATHNILALDKLGVNVICRPAIYGEVHQPLSPRIEELEKNSSDAIDFTVHHYLPDNFSYSRAGGCNVGMFYFETTRAPALWVRKSEILDGIIFPSQQAVQNFKLSPLYDGQPLEHCPLPCDINEYLMPHPVLDKFAHMKASGRFLFYTVGECTRRKNISGLIRAYLSEFGPQDHVGLVIKTNQAGQSPRAVGAYIEKIVAETLAGLKIVGAYPPIYLQCEALSRNELLSMHSMCDCFVMPSYGESWSWGAFDAMALGKTPIVTALDGFLEYIDNDTGWLVPGREETVFGTDNLHPILYSKQQNWISPDLLALRACMREAYANKAEQERKSKNGLKRALQFNEEAVGRKLLRALNNVKRSCN